MVDLTNILLDYVIGHLRRECVERQEQSTVNSSRHNESSYVSQSKVGAKAQHRKVICFNCNKEEHAAKFRRAPKHRHLLRRNNQTRKKSKWLFDSDCLFHVSFDKDLFGGVSNIEPSVNGNIQIAYGKTMRICGEGSETLKGKGCFVCSTTDLQYA